MSSESKHRKVTNQNPLMSFNTHAENFFSQFSFKSHLCFSTIDTAYSLISRNPNSLLLTPFLADPHKKFYYFKTVPNLGRCINILPPLLLQHRLHPQQQTSVNFLPGGCVREHFEKSCETFIWLFYVCISLCCRQWQTKKINPYLYGMKR